VTTANSNGADLLLSIPTHHACYLGHFPENPIVPGALLLKWVVDLIENKLQRKVIEIKQMKFLTTVKPGDQVRIISETKKDRLDVSLAAYVRETLTFKGTVICTEVEYPHD
jgi:3-hydroxyacyl-[acyl-carrier-protein] dehydratase